MKEALREFGLTENEIKIYLETLKLGIATPAEISEKTGLSRPYVYDAMERLLEKQMVSSVFKKEKKNYMATEPKYLVELETQRLEKIKSIVPELEMMQNSSEDIKVEHHTGQYTYKIMLNDILTTLKEGGEVLIFGMDDDYLLKTDKHYLTHLQQYYLRVRELGIKEKIIAKKNGVVYQSPPNVTKFRFLDNDIIGNTAFEVYGNKVLIFLWKNSNHLILVENKEVADSYRKQFSILWKAAEERQ